MATQQSPHISVLLNEAIEGLSIRPDGCYVDATFGRGGHSAAILEQLGPEGRLLAIDRDPTAIAAAERFADDARFTIEHGPFSELATFLNDHQLTGNVDGILFDLGVSSPQLDDAERGFSFMNDGPLDMRMDTSTGRSAAEWLAEAEESDIVWVLKTFGEERFAKRIARAIVNQRTETPLVRTQQLAELIAAASPTRERHKHPATRSFQAIRIYINSELEEIEKALRAALAGLAPGGRLVVISFHSLEDRIVKQFIRRYSKGEPIPRGLPLTDEQLRQRQSCPLKTKSKAIKPSEEEIALNSRARSSVLRIAERTGGSS